MSVKKLLLLAAAGSAVVGATAFAGGVDSTYSAPMAATAPTSYFYVQGNVGYASTGFADSYGPFAGNWTKGNGGFTWGVDAGYMWTQNLGLEVGYYMFPKASGTMTAASGIPGAATSNDQWALYGAAKFAVPVYPNMDIYGKAGVGYNRNNWTVGNASSSNHKWGFVGGAGVDYTFDNNVFLDVQYMYFQGNGQDFNGYVDSVSTVVHEYLKQQLQKLLSRHLVMRVRK
jgi:opacity protein-like surface antigen